MVDVLNAKMLTAIVTVSMAVSFTNPQSAPGYQVDSNLELFATEYGFLNEIPDQLNALLTLQYNDRNGLSLDRESWKKLAVNAEIQRAELIKSYTDRGMAPELVEKMFDKNRIEFDESGYNETLAAIAKKPRRRRRSSATSRPAQSSVTLGPTQLKVWKNENLRILSMKISSKSEVGTRAIKFEELRNPRRSLQIVEDGKGYFFVLLVGGDDYLVRVEQEKQVGLSVSIIIKQDVFHASNSNLTEFKRQYLGRYEQLVRLLENVGFKMPTEVIGSKTRLAEPKNAAADTGFQNVSLPEQITKEVGFLNQPFDELNALLTLQQHQQTGLTLDQNSWKNFTIGAEKQNTESDQEDDEESAMTDSVKRLLSRHDSGYERILIAVGAKGGRHGFSSSGSPPNNRMSCHGKHLRILSQSKGRKKDFHLEEIEPPWRSLRVIDHANGYFSTLLVGGPNLVRVLQKKDGSVSVSIIIDNDVFHASTKGLNELQQQHPERYDQLVKLLTNVGFKISTRDNQAEKNR